jgi:hypothetical protein
MSMSSDDGCFFVAGDYRGDRLNGTTVGSKPISLACRSIAPGCARNGSPEAYFFFGNRIG